MPRPNIRRITAGVGAIAAMLVVLAASAGAASAFDHPSFAILDGLQLNGDAYQAGTAIRVANTAQNQAGSVYATTPVDASGSWSVAYHVHVDSGIGAADGMAFVLQNEGPGALTPIWYDGGSGHGYEGVYPRVAIDLDIYGGTGGIVAGSQRPTSRRGDDGSYAAFPIGLWADDFAYQNPPEWYVWADYDAAAHQLAVSFSYTPDRPSSPTLTRTLDIAQILGHGPTYAGFAAATGAATMNFDLTSWHTDGLTTLDTAPPVITVPADKTIEATGPAGAPASFDATATDAVDGSVPVTCAPPSGSTFPLGDTTVTCTAADTRANRSSRSFTVSVRDTTPPTVTVPADLTLDAVSPAGVAVPFATSANDAVSGATPVTCRRPGANGSVTVASGDVLPIATTTVTCTSGDQAGNAGSAGFAVTVRSPGQAAANLKAVLTSLSLAGGPASAISSKIDRLIAALPAGSQATAGACQALVPLNNQIRAQTGTQPGKTLTRAQSDRLLAITGHIAGALAC